MSIWFKILASAMLIASSWSQADTLMLEDFQGGNYTGWTPTGYGTATVTRYAGNYSLRLTRYKSATQPMSTSGYENIQVSVQVAASSLESTDRCVAEVSPDAGLSWLNIVTVVDGQDDGVTMYSGSVTNGVLDNNRELLLRMRSQSNNNADYCWFDHIEITGDVDSTVKVNRTLLTYTQMFENKDFLADFSAYAVPENADDARNTFSGTLTLIGEATNGSFVEQGTNMASAYTNPSHLPEFSYQFVQGGGYIIPIERGLLSSTHASWQYILEPGRVWQEHSDAGMSRAVIPFSLQEAGGNCTHNGVMTFLFNDSGIVSNVAYQIASETCAYFKFNMWGMLDATYTKQSIASAAQVISDHEAEIAVRMPMKDISELANDYPSSGIDLSVLGSEQSPEHVSVYGVVIDGIHYVGGCSTRMGSYPYCDVLSLPSYSTAKSLVGGVGLMRLEQMYWGWQKDLIVGDYVDQCSGTQWDDVTFEHALDMTTGNYDSNGFGVDEASDAMRDGFFLKYTTAEKTAFSCSYAGKSAPGTEWVYHSTDTYILGLAMNAYYRSIEGSSAEFYADILVDQLWKPLNLSPVTYTSSRTFDADAQFFAGYGKTLAH